MTGWSREELGERRGRGNGGRGRVPRPLRGSWVGGAEEMGRGAEGRYVGSNKVRHRGIDHGSHIYKGHQSQTKSLDPENTPGACEAL